MLGLLEKHYTTTEACRILGVTTTMNGKVEAQSVLENLGWKTVKFKRD
ncbi:MAG: hypothetical protein QXF93_01365 [Saccharolobus sp.]